MVHLRNRKGAGVAEQAGRRMSVYLSAVGSQWKVLASSRFSNLWEDSAGLLTGKREKPPLFLAPLRGTGSLPGCLLSVGLRAVPSTLAGPHLKIQTLKTAPRQLPFGNWYRQGSGSFAAKSRHSPILPACIFCSSPAQSRPFL